LAAKSIYLRLLQRLQQVFCKVFDILRTILADQMAVFLLRKKNFL
jgi:hypothetical protein